jgi:HSP20 family protein
MTRRSGRRSAADTRPPSAGRDTRPSWMPIDVYRHGDNYVVHVDMPGIETGSIEITVEKNLLTVKAERTWQPSEGDPMVVSERPQGSFTRQLV